MELDDVHSILIIGPTSSDKNVDLSTALYDTVDILHQLGYKLSIIVENPTSLLSSGTFYDKTVVEKVTGDNVLKYVQKYHPDSILPTVGDRNALGIVSSLNGKIGETKILGPSFAASLATFKRELFIKKLTHANLPVIKFVSSDDEKEIYSFIRSIGFPIIARRRYSNRHSSGWTNINNLFELDNFMAMEDISDTKIEIERSIRGFSEYSFTILRDRYDNSSLVGTIEDIEPIGIHHLDSNLISPAVSLNDSKLQRLRNFSIKLARTFNIVGVCTVHFAYNHATNESYITEFIPRLSEETKFLEYATSYPVATAVAQLCLGYHLDKLQLDAGNYFNGATEPFVDHITSRFPQWSTNGQRYLGPSKTSNSSIVVNGFSLEEVLNKGALNDKLNNNFNRYNELRKLDDDELFEKIIHPTNWMLDVLSEAMRRNFEKPVLSEITGINMPYLTALQNIIDNSLIIREGEIDGSNVEHMVNMGVKGVGHSKLLLDSPDIVTKTVVKNKQAVSVANNDFINHNYFVTGGISNELQLSDRMKIIVRTPIITSKTDIMIRQFVLFQLAKSIDQNGLEPIIIGREPWNAPLSMRRKVVEIDDPHMEMKNLGLIKNDSVLNIIDLSKNLIETDDKRVFQFSAQELKNLKLTGGTSVRVMVVSDGENFLAPSVIYQAKRDGHLYEISSVNQFMTVEDRANISRLIKQELEDDSKVDIYNFELVKSNDHWLMTKKYRGMTNDIIRHELASSVHVIDTLVKLLLGNKIGDDLTLEKVFDNFDDKYLLTIDSKRYQLLDEEETKIELSKLRKNEN
ncbi:ATP-grasp domain-containing protein [Companilactobacillus futsaii]|uniref:carbamoyl-phosphate synthase (ammonia) n=2 Tax=Companilactobacillus futsaii TaxID=938155 RepID=A0A5B7T3K8_9LACO|nr:ATP-grasp domain-containing protein [Companilactobacillus futsaii]KRK99710.1 carbamoyl phosphate synthase large subunit [Companilactobacillus futsaii JCM 17355]QCX24751.1 ATP-grasp domain-containing protein [Companilactobacillus futsaii]